MCLPGHGHSDRLEEIDAYSIPKYAEAVKEVADALTEEPPVLIGWGLGGHIALEATTLLPEVAGVVVFGTPPLGRPALIDRAFFPGPAVEIGLRRQVSPEDAKIYAASLTHPDSELPIEGRVADVLATDRNARVGLCASILRGDYANQIEIVGLMSIPLAIIHGARDQLVDLSYIESLRTPTLWQNKVHIIEDAGHSPHLETPAEFDALVANFVAHL